MIAWKAWGGGGRWYPGSKHDKIIELFSSMKGYLQPPQPQSFSAGVTRAPCEDASRALTQNRAAQMRL
jgi:hypothetical protein